jgi:uracil-DNA glycosylase
MDHPPPSVPRKPTRASLARALNECRACDLWEGATQAVMGEGADGAEVMLVGEQAELVTITTHPSAILRAQHAERKAAMEEFVADLAGVAHWLSSH